MTDPTGKAIPGLTPARLEALPPRDRDFIASITDPQKQAAIVASLVRYQHADRLAPGDPVPPLALTHLDQSGMLRLDQFVGIQPLVLIFGSYT
jgi:hypothetical protein